MLKQHLLLYLKHIDLTRLGTESGAADDGKRASSVAWSCKEGREALGEGLSRKAGGADVRGGFGRLVWAMWGSCW